MKTVFSYDTVLAGRGGQGVIYLSRVMGQAALLQGLGVRTTETHGMAMRGGSVQCFVRVGNVYGPLFRAGTADLLMALHPAETSSAIHLLGKDGTVLVNGEEGYKKDTTPAQGQIVVSVDADSIAREYGYPRSANLALLGTAVVKVKRFPLEAASIERAIVKTSSKQVAEKNLEVFRAGMISS